MSLKVVPFESLGTVSYSLSIVTVAVSVAVCEIFSVRKWRELENQARGRPRSLKMAPFDRPYALLHKKMQQCVYGPNINFLSTSLQAKLRVRVDPRVGSVE